MKSKIEWTDYTFNYVWGCAKVSAACKFCYAEALDNRYHKDNPHWGINAPRLQLSDNYWKQPLKWNRDVITTGLDKVFCSSMADVFEILPPSNPASILLESERLKLWNLIERTPNLQWQLLTKRPENIDKCVPEQWLLHGFPNNVWLGVTVEDNVSVKNRVPKLLRFRGVCKILFLSCEPLLESISSTLEKYFWTWSEKDGTYIKNKLIDWVIGGGESGNDARQPNIRWFLELQGLAYGKFFFKQWGEWGVERIDQEYVYSRMGKKFAGNELNGKKYLDFPKAYTDGKRVG